jgi:acetyl esterase/lipase
VAGPTGEVNIRIVRPAGVTGVLPLVYHSHSVGGNMTAALTLMAKQCGGPHLTAQVLFYPVTDANLDTGTYQRYAEGTWLTREAMRWYWDAYLPDENRRSEITASPLQASVEQLRGLPPALIINGEHDVLRDASMTCSATNAKPTPASCPRPACP